MTTLKGTCKWFNFRKGFGFLERDDKEKDCFVHITALKAAGLKTLQEGEKLEYYNVIENHTLCILCLHA